MNVWKCRFAVYLSHKNICINYNTVKNIKQHFQRYQIGNMATKCQLMKRYKTRPNAASNLC